MLSRSEGEMIHRSDRIQTPQSPSKVRPDIYPLACPTPTPGRKFCRRSRSAKAAYSNCGVKYEREAGKDSTRRDHDNWAAQRRY